MLEWTMQKEQHILDYNIDISIPSIDPKKWIFEKFTCFEKTLFDELSKVVPVNKLYYFKRNNTKNIWIIIENPTSENILNLTEVYYDFLDKNIKDDSFYCEFLVFGVHEDSYLDIPNNKKVLRIKK